MTEPEGVEEDLFADLYVALCLRHPRLTNLDTWTGMTQTTRRMPPRLRSNLTQLLRACLPCLWVIRSTNLPTTPNLRLRQRRAHTRFRWMAEDSKMDRAICTRAGTTGPQPLAQNPKPRAPVLPLVRELVSKKMGKSIKVIAVFSSSVSPSSILKVLSLRQNPLSPGTASRCGCHHSHHSRS